MLRKPKVGELFLISLLRAVAHEQKTLGIPRTDENQTQWAITTGLGPLLRQFVCGTRSLIPETCAQALLLSELQAKAKIKRQLHATEEIIDVCNGLAGTLTLLKGISICEQYYSEAYLRPMVDLDLLVRQPDVAAVEAALRRLGYTQGSSLPESFYENFHHSMPYLHPRTHVCVEVHTALFPPQSRIGRASVFSVQNVSTHLRPSKFHGRDVFRLSPELELLYIAGHAVRELRVFRTLIPVFDMLLLLKRTASQLNWDTVIGSTRESLVASRLWMMMSYLKKHSLVEIDSSVRNALAKRINRLERVTNGLIHHEMDKYAVGGRSLIAGRSDLRSIYWSTLVGSNTPVVKLLRIPWNLAFPPDRTDRFTPSYQFQRFRSALGRCGIRGTRDRHA